MNVQAVCSKCGATYGHHKVVGYNCPRRFYSEKRGRWRKTTFGECFEFSEPPSVVVSKKNPFESMKAYWVCYDVKKDRQFIIYVDPTGKLTRDQITSFVAQSQGISKKKVYIGRYELERSITPNAFRYNIDWISNPHW